MPGDLERQQAWMQAAILEPGGVTGIEGVVTSSPTLSAAGWLAVYQQGYRARLVECMRAHYPVLCHVLGRALFDAFALDYLAACPSRSRTLDDLGARFAEHLEATRPGGREDWCDLMIDIARYERVFTEVRAGQGTEDLAEMVLPALSHPGWADAEIVPAPCLRLLTLDFPAHEYVAAVRRGEDSRPLPKRAKTFLAMSRRDYVVTVIEVDEGHWRLLTALASGNRLAPAACDSGVTSSEAARCLCEWAESRLFTAIVLPSEILVPISSEISTELSISVATRGPARERKEPCP